MGRPYPGEFDAIPESRRRSKGELRALGIVPRAPAVPPEVPTIAEQASRAPSGRLIVCGAARTPEPILDRLTQIRRLLAATRGKGTSAALSFPAHGRHREHFAAFIKAEVAKWAKS